MNLRYLAVDRIVRPVDPDSLDPDSLDSDSLDPDNLHLVDNVHIRLDSRRHVHVDVHVHDVHVHVHVHVRIVDRRIELSEALALQ